ncbi:UPF0481 protein At3g47200-like [Cornus florida]|uniref:UPF0481 protein At3g47200-like n=1 Tax=Cornus florida TaxID=4283 RepID=UPI00289DD22E|nr:UPF0481 protein At3g47200-like [Cornus florida]
MAAEQPKEFLSSEDHASTNKVTEGAISFHEYKRRIENHFLEEEKNNKITPHERWKKCIKATLGVLKHRPSSFAIYRVPTKLRKINEDAYSPRMVSIGPFHHGRNDLLKMEEHKWRYMLFLLARTSDRVKAVDKCGEVIGSLQQRVPGCYAEDLNMTREELMEILLVDGCFILELFLSAKQSPRHLLEMLHIFYRPPFSDTHTKVDHDDTLGFKHRATNLLEAGIEIEKASTNSCGLLEITFNDGVIQFPALSIDETMETIFRNLIAFEQCSVDGMHYITSYVMLIKRLIHSPQDRDRVVRGESICSEVIAPKDFYLAKICEDVNKYTNSWWHFRRIKAYLSVLGRKCMDSLKNNYFPNPWSFISFAAAVVLIVLTALQTIYTMRS